MIPSSVGPFKCENIRAFMWESMLTLRRDFLETILFPYSNLLLD